jgi:hypothetical protein
MMLLNSVGLVQGNTGRKEERICYDQSLCARQGVRGRVDCFGFGLKLLPINYIRFSSGKV